MTQNEYHFGTVWEHTLKVVSLASMCDGINEGSRMVLMLSALLHDIGKICCREVAEDGKVHFFKHELESDWMIEGILRTLKFSNDEIKEVRFLSLNHVNCKSWGYRCEKMKVKKLRRLQYICLTEERFHLLMSLIHADNMAHAEDKCMPEQVPVIIERTERMKAEGSAMFGYRLPLTGVDIMNIKGICPGPQVKECMDYLLKIAFVNPLQSQEEFEKILMGYRFSKQQGVRGRSESTIIEASNGTERR